MQAGSEETIVIPASTTGLTSTTDPSNHIDSTTNISPIANDYSRPEIGEFILLTDDEMKRLRVDGLQKKLKAKGLSIKRLKVELIYRLKKAMENKITIVTVTNDEDVPSNVFEDGVMWKRLEPLGKTLGEPNELN